MKKKEFQSIAYLIGCILNEQIPDASLLEGMDHQQLFRFAREHSVDVMVAEALEQCGVFAGDTFSKELKDAWMQVKNRAIRKGILFDVEYRKIAAYLEASKIWYMPLKGYILRQLYPNPVMRQMADIDILFDENYQHQIHDYMVGEGYKAEMIGKFNHDEYLKAPFYNFEFHTHLFNAHSSGELVKHYDNVKERLLPVKEDSCEYRFTDEDFYLYMVAHAYKHYQNGGTGIRTLADVYIYQKKKGEQMNKAYVAEQAELYGIGAFEAQMRELAEVLFKNPGMDLHLTEEQVQMLGFIEDSGTYGSEEHVVQKRMSEVENEGDSNLKKKWRYYWSRLWPSSDWMKNAEPYCRKHPWTIPFFRIKRILRGVFCRREKIKRELRTLDKNLKSDKKS